MCFEKRVEYSGLLCRCHACGIAVCVAADLCIVYSGLFYRRHARRVATCSAVVMRVEWRLIPPPRAWRLVCDCIYGLCFSMVSVLACNFSLKLRCAIKIPGYLIARVMASDEPILSAEATKEMRCAQCNGPLDVLAPGVRCRSNMEQQFTCEKCASVDIVDSADF